jgi:hypothetical protein
MISKHIIFKCKLSIVIFLLLIFSVTITNAQNSPSLIIDNSEIQFSEVSLPYWLKAGQTIGLGVNARNVSVLEFNVNGSSLEFSQVISLSNSQTVPINKAWKIEGIGLNRNDTTSSIGLNLNKVNGTNGSSNLPNLYVSPVKFETVGTYQWKVPPGITVICIEIWGGGGGALGVTANQNSGGGGGGGYGYECFNVVPGTNYTITVGGGGSGSVSGGTSSVGNLISATGGSSGSVANNCTSASGGAGGTSNASYSLTGESGGLGTGCPTNTLGCGGTGGKAGYGGAGGVPGCTFSNGTAGSAPGGGGGGTWTAPHVNNTPRSGGAGARGQVNIYF